LTSKFRPRLKPDEAEVLEKYRAIKRESEKFGLDEKNVKHGWIKNKTASLFFKNPNFKTEDQQGFETMRQEIIDSISNHIPKYIPIDREEVIEGHLLVVDPADIHIGKLCEAFDTGEDYNCQIAVQRVREGVQGIIRKAKGFNIDKILFIGGNDILHIDTPNRTTTGGTNQDTDGMWYSNFLTAKKLYVEILEMLLPIADVHFTFNPSNHDYMSGFFLADVIQTWFKDSKNITFDCSISHRKGFLYGKNLIGTTHGDGAKQQDLPLLMAAEFPLEWSQSKHRYIYTHHIHHKSAKDYVGITVESLRSPSGSDSWHHKKGYLSIKAVEGFIHHKEFGQVARLTHIF
jgi:hypothetical protein